MDSHHILINLHSNVHYLSISQLPCSSYVSYRIVSLARCVAHSVPTPSLTNQPVFFLLDFLPPFSPFSLYHTRHRTSYHARYSFLYCTCTPTHLALFLFISFPPPPSFLPLCSPSAPLGSRTFTRTHLLAHRRIHFSF